VPGVWSVGRWAVRLGTLWGFGGAVLLPGFVGFAVRSAGPVAGPGGPACVRFCVATGCAGVVGWLCDWGGLAPALRQAQDVALLLGARVGVSPGGPSTKLRTSYRGGCSAVRRVVCVGFGVRGVRFVSAVVWAARVSALCSSLPGLRVLGVLSWPWGSQARPAVR